MRLAVLAFVLSCAAVGGAQTAGKAADAKVDPGVKLSPEAAYERAAAPVDITHRDISNWSDIEQNALSVAVGQAKAACIEREQVTYVGDHLIGYARLCALGQQWPEVYQAATLYINSGDEERPQLAQAYALEVQADLNLKQEKDALGTCIAMLKVIPYNALVDDVTTGAARYMQFAYTNDALELLINRQRVLLGLLRGAQPDGGDWPTEPTVSPIPLHTVVQHALDNAALHQYMGRPGMAARIIEDIDEAMPKELLGTKMPELKSAVSLMAPVETPAAKPVFGNVTVFLLFPPWCAQCVRLGSQMKDAMEREQGKMALKV